MPVIRPMTEDDAEAALRLTIETFDDLSRRRNEEPEPPPSEPGAACFRATAPSRATIPDGSWVAEDEHGLAGCALAVKREGIWGLSLLVVRPGLQSAGIGSDLLRRAHDYAHDAKGRIILSSPDARAVRAYSRLGLDLHPCFLAKGTPRDVRAPEGLREGTVDDIPFVEEVDRFARGGGRAARASRRMLEMRQTLLILPGRGYAVLRRRRAADAGRPGRRERRRGAAGRARAGRRDDHARLPHGGAAVGGPGAAGGRARRAAAPTASRSSRATSAASGRTCPAARSCEGGHKFPMTNRLGHHN